MLTDQRNLVNAEENIPGDPGFELGQCLPAPAVRQAWRRVIRVKMADRKTNNVPNSSANLLLNAAPEFNFNLPFIPVSQATGPAVLSGGKTIANAITLLVGRVLTNRYILAT